jgi:hypothetical protein
MQLTHALVEDHDLQINTSKECIIESADYIRELFVDMLKIVQLNQVMMHIF